MTSVPVTEKVYCRSSFHYTRSCPPLMTGVLCGSCRDGKGTVLRKKCVTCHDGFISLTVGLGL